MGGNAKDQPPAGARSAEISLTLPDGQTVRVRLHERCETRGPHPWRYLIGVPSWVATPTGVEAAEYRVWVTAGQNPWAAPPSLLRKPSVS